MDTGLRRLWIRRRSKGHDSSADPTLKNLRINHSNHSSPLNPAYQTVPQSTGPSTRNGSSKLLHQASTDAFRPPSGNRKQPMLVGVSRPSTAPSRPGTAGSGSLMTAVNRAADSVVVTEQDYKRPTEKYSRDQMQPKSPRSVDIFSISKPASPRVYNEDIAERNLDFSRIAHTSPRYPYRESARFQEDVAARNAYPPLPGDIVDLSRSSYPIYLDDRDPTAINSTKRTALDQHGAPGLISDEDPFVGFSDFSPFVSQHSQAHTDSHHGPPPPRSSHNEYHISSPARPHTGDHIDRVNGHLPGEKTSRSFAQVSLYPHRQLVGPHALHSGRSHEAARSESLRNYVLSQSELVQYRSATSNSRRPVTRPDENGEYAHGSDRSGRPPSAMSNTSSVKRSINLTNRTIMDLTGDDSEVFSELSPESTYSSSPILESAKTDTMKRMHPAVVSPVIRHDPMGQPNSFRSPDVFEGTVPNVPVQASDVHVSQTPRKLVSDQPGPNQGAPSNSVTNAFSPINTIATFEPRKSIFIDQQLMDDLARELPSVNSVEFNGQDPLVSNDARESEVSHQLRHPITTDEHSPVSGTTSESLGSMPNGANGPSDGDNNRIGNKSISNSTDVGTQDHTETPDTLATPQSQPVIQMTPESLHSIDFVDPSRSFGVTARDFAVTPSKPFLESVPEDFEPSLQNKPKRPAQVTTASRTTSHDSAHSNRKVAKAPAIYRATFDEAEFAQKQADARAALVRLQQSLNENFLSQPHPPPAKQPSRTQRHHSSLSDGKPVAPSSIFAQARTTSPTSTDKRNSAATSASSDDGRPRTSYHSLTTSVNSNMDPNSTASGTNYRRSTQDKPRIQLDTNGPGPSILNDGQDIDSAPLSVNGQVLPRYLNHAPVPPSPGEISLSSFPIPLSSPRQSFRQDRDSPDMSRQSGSHQSQHSNANSGVMSRQLKRQSSVRSQASSASAFSIPYHMIPDRSSSARDRSVLE
ncbi:hypothetical protein B0A52_09574 [Exophiala mesophila]|uniref:Uncharacterized protein n=1 Tax=Exophiala mesophila TaxID=212818 RepID=A0A438MT31_EXOME|nr:hypothetical protein B0A52_09574 [Exophiala mesophila]